MKRNILALTAIVLAIGFSAFTNADSKKDLVQYYYFQISGSYNPDVAPLQSNASFIQFSESVPLGTGCGAAAKQCVSGFTSGQVQQTSPGVYQLIDNSQVPAVTPRRKAS